MRTEISYDLRMNFDTSVVAFWNWTKISLAVEDKDDGKDISDNMEFGGDTPTVVMTICGVIVSALVIYILYR